MADSSSIAAFVERHYRCHPVTASFTGVTDHDHRLPDWTSSARHEARDEIVELRRSLRSTNGTDEEALAVACLDVEASELASPHFYARNPCLYTGEAIFGVVALMLRHYAPADERAAAMVTRLATVSGFLEAACLALDTPAPSLWIDRAARECAAGRDLFMHGIDLWCAEHDVAETLRADLNAVGAAAAVALAGFAGWLEACPRNDDGACGPEHLAVLLEKAHWRTESANELVAAMYEDLESATQQWRAAATPDEWSAVQQRLAERHPSAGDYLERFHELWEAARQLAEVNGLVTWMDFPVEYHAMPRWARSVAAQLYFLHYRSPAVVGGPAVHRYLTPTVHGDAQDERKRVLRATNDWVIKSNHVVHHGGIGHHVQNSFARQAASPIGRIAGIDGASRLALPCAGTLVEGWACYATDLMAEYGFFTDDELIAHKHARVRQVARGIADLDIHLDRQTLSQAIGFLKARTGMDEEAARREITRTSMFPGTGLIYWLGTTTLHEMRREFAHRYDRNGIRGFHDRVLREGSVPVALIRERMATEGTA